MNFAILELRNADRNGFGAFAGELFYFLQLFAKLLGVLDLRHGERIRRARLDSF